MQNLINLLMEHYLKFLSRISLIYFLQVESTLMLQKWQIGNNFELNFSILIDTNSIRTILHLNDGVFNGKQIISKDRMKDLHIIVFPMSYEYSFNSWFPFLWTMGYARGWAVSPYYGHEIVLHPGNIDGFSSLTVLLPQDNISICVFVNLDGTNFPFAVAFYAIDRLLGIQPRDWNQYFLDQQQKNEEEAAAEWFF